MKIMSLRNNVLIVSIAIVTLQTQIACQTPKTQKAYMNKTYKRLKRNLKFAQVSKLNDTVKVLFPSNLRFGFNSSSINGNIMPKMHRFAKALNKYNRTSILINGHTDNVGEKNYNNELSSKRADSAKVALVNYNVDGNRINTWGLGMRYPIATNETEEGRSLNRRVEFVVLYKGKD
jgi:outer membrane protein OmpA-like peptidoglycan-associated protein